MFFLDLIKVQIHCFVGGEIFSFCWMVFQTCDFLYHGFSSDKLLCQTNSKQTLLILLHSERPKLYTILAFLSAIGLKSQTCWILPIKNGQLKWVFVGLIYHSAMTVLVYIAFPENQRSWNIGRMINRYLIWLAGIPRFNLPLDWWVEDQCICYASDRFINTIIILINFLLHLSMLK